MKVKVKKRTKLMILRKVFNKKFSFFIITGKKKLLFEFFNKNSVIHISFFKYLISLDFMVKYAFSYICIFNSKDIVKLFELIYDTRMVVHQICINNSFINFYGVINFNQILVKQVLILNIFLNYIYILEFLILSLILNLIETIYFLLEKKC